MAVCYENCGLYKIDITLFKEDYLNKKLDINKLEEYAKCVTNNTTESPLGSIFYIKNNLQHYVKEYKEYLKNKLIINFDCVSDGNDIFFFPTQQIKNDQSKHENIINAFASTDYIRVHINKGFGFYPSDNFNFKYAYGVCGLKKGLFYYLDRIHTSRDIIFNEENIELLSDGVCKLIKTTHTSR